ncbi:hypothetical protein BV898_03840 [Hypsibius exemplaris]|uniref:Uncharacterized protein n=1 Tax=Hypsibius exemplaris TaxID=2072580 RepID=A0A1W0X4D6_HYPEX|nr:hypothetical protein BV898_03840 [Hypsibius exemplaris]
MGAVCSCACGYKDLQQPQGMSQGAAGPIANRSKPFSGAVARSGVLQSVAEPQPGEPGYEEWQKGQLLARTADEFGINLDPAANVAVEGEVKEHASMVDDDIGDVCIDPSKQPMRFGYKIHHHCVRRHGSSLIAAHEVKGHYTDTGIYLAYDVLQKILAERQRPTVESVGGHTTSAADQSRQILTVSQPPVTPFNNAVDKNETE